jgi:hypothetical protein
MLVEMVNLLMSAEVDAVCGAGYGERADERSNRRNGYRERAKGPIRGDWTKPLRGSFRFVRWRGILLDAARARVLVSISSRSDAAETRVWTDASPSPSGTRAGSRTDVSNRGAACSIAPSRRGTQRVPAALCRLLKTPDSNRRAELPRRLPPTGLYVDARSRGISLSLAASLARPT